MTIELIGKWRGALLAAVAPALLAGFSDSPGEENVGVHEFVHLVEQQEVESGLPPEVPLDVVQQWVNYVARELTHPSNRRAGISDYAYTNEHEFLAVLSEYFFGSPEKLKANNPALYELLRGLFHQDPGALSSHFPRFHQHLRANDPCPCGSGKRFKDCCGVRKT